MITRALVPTMLSTGLKRCLGAGSIGLSLLFPCAGFGQDSDPGAPTTDSALTQSVQYTEQVETLQSRIAELTSNNGPYDENLLSPLDALTRIYLEAGDFESAAALLDQQLQIHRINRGLYAAEQIPLVESLIALHGDAGNWEQVNNNLGYLGWLYQRDSSLDIETRLQGLHKLGTWHLRSLGNDLREREASHLVELARIDQRTTALAESHYGEDDPQLTPYLYSQALSDLYIALAIMLTSETSQDLMLLTEGIRDGRMPGLGMRNVDLTSTADVEAVYGSRASTVIERSFKNNMDDNISKLERIQTLYADAGDTEAEGMALMALADSVLMRQQFEKRAGNFAGIRRGTSSVGPAITHYTEALEKFRQSGFSEEELALFTRCPVLLPIVEFHTRLREAVVPCERDENGVLDLGEHSLVSTLIPGLEGEVPGESKSIVATVQFSVRSNGQISNHELIQIEPDDTPSRVKVRKLLEILQFRPALIDGSAHRTNQVQLQVRIPDYD